MTPRAHGSGDAGMSADLDAYRRHRNDAFPASDLTELVGALGRSDQPQVVFARLADLAVAVLCDACEVEIDDGSGSRFRALREREAGPLAGQPEDPEAASDPVAVVPEVTEVHVAFSGPGREQHPAYAGIVTFSWSRHRSTDAEELAATLAVRHAETLVDHERLLNLLGTAEARAAEAAISAITSRSINLAVGIAMHQYDDSEETSEDLLRQSAAANGQALYVAAARAVRGRAVPERPSGTRPRAAGARGFPRSLDPGSSASEP